MHSTDTSPAKSVVEELHALRALSKEMLRDYEAKLNSEIDCVEKAVSPLLSKKIPTSKLRDLRDMLTLLRHLSMKLEKSRKKDLRKIDAVVSDLYLVIENW